MPYMYKQQERDFDESKHPRDEHGRWTDGGDGGDESGGTDFRPPSGKTWQGIVEAAKDAWHAANPRITDDKIALVSNIDELMASAAKYQDKRDWYVRHRPFAIELFGKNEPYFEKFVAATSIHSPGEVNTDEALRATIHFLHGGTFEAKNYTGVLPSIRTELLKVQHGEPLTGEKVVPFHQALMGDWDVAPADSHMKELLFKNPTTSGGDRAQPAVTLAVCRAISKELGWKPAEIQAVLWCVKKANEEKGLAHIVWDYLQFMKKQESRVRALLETDKKLRSRASFQKSLNEDGVEAELEQEAEGWHNAELLLEFFQAIHDAVGDNPSAQDVTDALDMLVEQKDFDESKHPRDEHGRWTDGGGGDGGVEDILNPTGPDRADMPKDSIKHAIRETKNWFPDVPAKDIKIDDDEDHNYNCIGWAMGDNRRWWWPGHGGSGFYWPNDDAPTVAAFDHLLKDKAHAVEVDVDDQQLEKGFVKLALYSQEEDAKENPDAYPSHLARQLSNGEWSSKMGWSYLVRHGNDIKATDNAEYGGLVKIYKVPEKEWKRLRTL